MQPGILREHAALVGILYRGADILILLIATLVMYDLRFPYDPMPGQYWLAIVLMILVSQSAFTISGIYKPRRGRSITYELYILVIAWSVATVSLATLAFLTRTGEWYSRLWFGFTIGSSLLGMALVRVLARIVLQRLRAAGRNLRNVVIIGAGSLGADVARNINENTWVGLRPTAFFDDDPEVQGSRIQGVKVRGKVDDVYPYIESARLGKEEDGSPVDQVWIALPLRAESRIQEVCARLLDTSVSVSFVPNIFGFQLLNQSVDQFAELPLVNLSSSGMSGYKPLLKALEDLVLGTLILILISPILLILSIAIKLNSKGPIIYRQTRYGIDGREIVIWKFRTMDVCEDDEEYRQASQDDERVTGLGRFLRRTSLDELPQFINVLQGRMSIVGPRPHPVLQNETYRSRIPGYMLRHKIKPGITGLAQVSGYRGATETDDKMQKRIDLDIKYIREWSIWLDLKIVIKSIFYGWGGHGAY
jgi:putative colanic acid biosynthesis UDP-glucose lipid carrier transferase